MSIPVKDVSTYADFSGLDALKRSAHQNDPAALHAVAKQFESLFARMMIKSMREAVGKDPIFGSDQEKMYQEMFDDQLSLEMSRGRGLGLADMLVRQLQRAAHSAAAPAAAGAATAAPLTRSQAPASADEQSRFVDQVLPAAQAAAQQLGVDPKGLIAQAALESNWGKSVPHDADGRISHNLFGIKAAGTWEGPAVTAPTTEVESGTAVPTRASFRAYDDSAQSFQDYVSFLRGNPRYAAALNTGANVQAFAAALQQGGYATDPNYARKVSSLAQSLANALSRSPALKSAAAAPISGETSLL
ncbi:MAG TPA: glucosaminidase domain-containing protein [Candidatus Dormibacteraeota bacterium]|nr:glucosaminidase domain-containing protein [Candidatus Dormibacteraeota bacterium]